MTQPVQLVTQVVAQQDLKRDDYEVLDAIPLVKYEISPICFIYVERPFTVTFNKL